MRDPTGVGGLGKIFEIIIGIGSVAGGGALILLGRSLWRGSAAAASVTTVIAGLVAIAGLGVLGYMGRELTSVAYLPEIVFLGAVGALLAGWGSAVVAVLAGRRAARTLTAEYRNAAAQDRAAAAPFYLSHLFYCPLILIPVVLAIGDWNQRSLLEGSRANDVLASSKPSRMDQVNPDAQRLAAEASAADRLPWNPFAGAAEGDWAAFSVTAKEMAPNTAMTFTVLGAEDAQALQRSIGIKESDIDAKKIGVRIEGYGLYGAQYEFLLTRDGAPNWRHVLGYPEEIRSIDSVKAEDAALKVGGRTFACRKLSFVGRNWHDQRVRIEAWLSKDVPGPGFVAFTVKIPMADSMASFNARFELVGFGNKSGATWGALPAGVAQERAKAESLLFPIDVFADAAPGDFTELSDGASWLIRYEIKNIDDSWVSLEIQTTDPRIGRVMSEQMQLSRRKPSWGELSPSYGPYELRSGGAVSDEIRTVGGKDFACKKRTFDYVRTANVDHGALAGTVHPGTLSQTVWFSSEVKGIGIAALTIPDERAPAALEVKAYGNKDGTLWGSPSKP